MTAHTPMSEREYRAIINRQYRLPAQLELARIRLSELKSEREWIAFNADGRPIRSERYWRLPAMVSRLERKITALEVEARRYGMHELLTDPEFVNQAWEREIKAAWERCER